MKKRDIDVSSGGEHVEMNEAGKTRAKKYTKEYYMPPEAYLWTEWFRFHNGQCATRCPYRPNQCYVGSETCTECENFEAMQIVTATSGRVYCKRKKENIKPLPECYFLRYGADKTEQESAKEFDDELCPW